LILNPYRSSSIDLAIASDLREHARPRGEGRGGGQRTVSVIMIDTVHTVTDNIYVNNTPVSYYSISAHMVVDEYEFYRIVSAAFVHAGIMHIGMNMMSLYQLGCGLEAQVLHPHAMPCHNMP
jgi:Rhomboid family